MMSSVILATLSMFSTFAPVERWDLKMTLHVPRIYDNSLSTGRRKYQAQHIRGRFTVRYVPYGEPEIEFEYLENRTHKVGLSRVTYEASVDDQVPIWHGIGDNRTGKFKTRSVAIKVVASPSYSRGFTPTEDNTLVMTLSGRGSSSGRRLNGRVAGQIGCGCADYGHESPTRIWGQDTVVDKAAVYGTWTAKLVE